MAQRILFLRGVPSDGADSEERIHGPRDLVDDSLEIDEAFLDELEFIFSDREISLRVDDKNLLEYDKIIFQRVARLYRIAYPAAVLLQHKQKTFINSGLLHYAGIDKLSQYARFYSLGVPFPKTFFARSGIIRQKSATFFPYPFIVKGILTSGGRKNDLIRSQKQLDQLEIDDNPETGHVVAQEFIPNDGDYRLLFIGDELLVLHRTAEDGSHVNNTSAGGAAEIIPADTLSPLVIEQARQLQKEFQFEICGVDVIIDKETGKHYFLEINSQPQVFTGAEVDVKIGILCTMLNNNEL